MRACGIGLNRIAKPIFIFATAMALLTFIVNETIVPVTNSQSKTLAVWALGQKNIPNGKQNFTFKEISQILGKNEEWARAKFCRGKLKLKESLKNEK